MRNVNSKDPLICFRKEDLIKFGIILFLLLSISLYMYHKYQVNKCENFNNNNKKKLNKCGFR
jgi:hypothetical protein